jgi:hypothetical protein
MLEGGDATYLSANLLFWLSCLVFVDFTFRSVAAYCMSQMVLSLLHVLFGHGLSWLD